MKYSLLWLALCAPLGLVSADDGMPPGPSLGQPGAPYAMPAPGWHGATSQRGTANEAGARVREGVDALLTFLNQEPRPTELKVAAFLEEKIAPAFDFERMADMVAGPYGPGLSKQQRQDLVQNIEQDFLRVLTKHLAAYDSQRIRYFRPHQRRDGLAQVTVGIMNPNSYPSRLDFRLHQSADGWKVYDVEANGSSAVNHYRQRFMRTGAVQPGNPSRP